MKAFEVLKGLKSLGSEGARDPCYGVKVGDLQKIRKRIGEGTVDHGDTARKTPFAPDYIRKVAKMGRVGKKKKTAKC